MPGLPGSCHVQIQAAQPRQLLNPPAPHPGRLWIGDRTRRLSPVSPVSFSRCAVVGSIIDEFRQDIHRGHAYPTDLLAEGHPAIAQQMDGLIEEAQSLISQRERLR